MTVDHQFYLSGKEHLTEPEAAHYCCVSLSQFKKKHLDYGIGSRRFIGKKIYRRSDLETAIEGRHHR
jgi:hypothetical protein